MKICIDAGHGGKDSGAVGVNGRLEKEDNLRMARALESAMKGRGHTALMTRTGDTYPSLNERADAANDWGADVFVSLHRNSYSDPAANGGEVLYGTTASAASIRLAEAIDANMNRAAGFRDRGAKRQGATVLQRTRMPAVTIEAGFVTSAPDNGKFDNGFDAMIKSFADSLESVFGKGSAKPPAPEPAPANPLAYVTTGNARLWKDVGRVQDGTAVTLDAYNEGDLYARVKDGGGTEYLVEWAGVRKG
jgi:N-acetylmuramoyl-L-alanine amidase